MLTLFSGEVFRYHPNGVMLNSPAAYRDLCNHKANVRKGRFYELFSRNADNISTFTTVNKAAHARKRRALASAFSDKALRSAERFIIQHVERWCELSLDDDGKDWSEARNFVHWADSLFLDILAELGFGRSLGLKEPGENPFRAIPYATVSYTGFMYTITHSPLLSTWLWLKPRGLDYLLEYIAPKEIRNFYSFVDASIAERAELEVKRQNTEIVEKDQRKDMLHYLFRATDPNSDMPAYSLQELNAEANLLIVAGSDTTAVSLSSLFFYLTHNLRVQAKVVAEIRSTFVDAANICSGPALTSCVYLRACIDEGMRMAPPAPSELVREVLPGGTEVAGHFFRAGVQLGTAAWAFNHHEGFFPDPHVFRPERWIIDPVADITAEEVTRARSCFQPFSAGPASCLGKNLALMELMIIAARVMYTMDLRVLPGSTLGEGAPHLGWGRSKRNQYQLHDLFVSNSDGPMLQLRKYSGKGP